MLLMLQIFRQDAGARLLSESENVPKLPGRTLQGKKRTRNSRENDSQQQQLGKRHNFELIVVQRETKKPDDATQILWALNRAEVVQHELTHDVLRSGWRLVQFDLRSDIVQSS